MNKINANTIIKNLTGILCGAIIISLLFPFVSVGASANAVGMAESDASTALNGFQILTEGGFFGILLVICPILILVANYLPQIEKYKKIMSLALSVIGVIMMFLASGSISSAGNAAGDAANQITGSSVSVEVKTNFLIGFWLMLIFFIGIAALSAIQFFNLKCNKVFDAVNDGNPDANAPEINLNKITDFAKNTANKAKGSPVNQPTAKSPYVGYVPPQNNPVPPANPVNVNRPINNFPQTNYQPIQPTVAKENPEKIMDLIKKLYDMKEAGILTDEEFNVKKQELLNKM